MYIELEQAQLACSDFASASPEEHVQLSIAISLKRIADNLDKSREIDESPLHKKIVRVID